MRWSRRSTIAAATAPAALVHHSDRGTQYLSMRYTERLADAGIAPSVGSRGDSYDNALAESVIGLYKTEVIQRRGPWRSLEAVEFATLEWVDWFNTRRLLEPIGYVPPAEFEARYYQQAAVQRQLSEVSHAALWSRDRKRGLMLSHDTTLMLGVVTRERCGPVAETKSDFHGFYSSCRSIR